MTSTAWSFEKRKPEAGKQCELECECEGVTSGE